EDHLIERQYSVPAPAHPATVKRVVALEPAAGQALIGMQEVGPSADLAGVITLKRTIDQRRGNLVRMQPAADVGGHVVEENTVFDQESGSDLGGDRERRPS